jgi:hypothetical protein
MNNLKFSHSVYNKINYFYIYFEKSLIIMGTYEEEVIEMCDLTFFER